MTRKTKTPLPVEKVCRECQRVFTRPTRNRDGRYRLRSSDKWRTQRYCCVECCIAHKTRRSAGVAGPWMMWPQLASLEPPRQQARNASETGARPAQRSRKPCKTGAEAIEKAIERAERVAFVLAQKTEARTFAEIGQRLDPPVTAQATCKAYWRALDQTAPFRHDRIDR
jgi:hypothetical protein